MSYERAIVSATIPAAATSVDLTFPLKSDFALPLGLRGKITSGSDATTIIQLKDADGKIFYLDAAAKDYTTAIDKYIVTDDTTTGLTVGVPTDLTGVAIGAGLGFGQTTIKSPVTLTWSSGTAGETLLLWLDYKSHAERIRTTLTTPNPAASIATVVYVPQKFVKVLGFRFTCVTDAASQIEIKDADARVLYKDAADKDYHGAGGLARAIVADDTLTGITPQTLDATGAAMAVNQIAGIGTGMGRSPFTVTWSNNGTAGDIGTLDLYVER